MKKLTKLMLAGTSIAGLALVAYGIGNSKGYLEGEKSKSTIKPLDDDEDLEDDFDIDEDLFKDKEKNV